MGRQSCIEMLWVPKMSSTALNRDYSAFVAPTTMSEIETNSVGNGLLGVSLSPGHRGYVGSPTHSTHSTPHSLTNWGQSISASDPANGATTSVAG